MVFQELQWWFNFVSIIWNGSEFPHNAHSLNNINQNQCCNNIALKTKVSLSKYATKRKQVMFFLRESKDLKASNWNCHCLGTGWRPFFLILGILHFFQQFSPTATSGKQKAMSLNLLQFNKSSNQNFSLYSFYKTREVIIK